MSKGKGKGKVISSTICVCVIVTTKLRHTTETFYAQAQLMGRR